MKAIRPIILTDAMLLNSTIAEPDSVNGETTPWSATEINAAGDLRYQSTLSATVTISIASPAVVNWPGHTLAPGQQVVFSTTGALPSPFVAGTIYYVSALNDINNFTLTTKPNGRAITTTGSQSGTHTGSAPIHSLWEALQGARGTATISQASPGVVTWTNHGRANGDAVVFTTTGALPAPLVVGTTYYVVGATTSTFNVSATAGGTGINTTNAGSGVHTCGLSVNYNAAPLQSPLVWAEAKPTNRWAMLDDQLGTVSVASDHITLQLNAGPFDSFAAMEVDATTVEAVLYVPPQTNALTNIFAIDNAAWVKTNASVSADATNAPDTTVTADKLVETNATGGHSVTQAASTTANQTNVFSIYAKQAGRKYVRVSMNDGGANSVWSIFDLNAGTVISSGATGTGSAAVAVIALSGGTTVSGYYRCSIAGIAASAGTVTCKVELLDNSQNQSYTGDNASGAYLWGAQLEATLSAATAGVVYDYQTNLSNGVNVGNWFQYFYEPVYNADIVQVTNFVDSSISSLPMYGSATFTVTISKPGGQVQCGLVKVGIAFDLGTTLENPEISIVDYSVKTTDAYGNVTLTQRPFSNLVKAKVIVTDTEVDSVVQVLRQYRATPMVWLVAADAGFSSTIVFGFIKEWTMTPVTVGQPAVLNITLEGLT